MILGIYGSGGLGQEVLELAKQINNASRRWEDILFIDDINPDRKIENYNAHSFENLKTLFNPSEIEVIIGVGEPSLRKKMYNKIISAGYSLATLIHPSVHVPQSTVVKQGVIIQSTAYISSNIEFCENSYIHPLTSVGHGCKIHPHCIISNNTSIAGDCEVGEATYIATGVMVKEGVAIGSNVIIGMASAVFRDIENDVIVLGNPARSLRKNENQQVFQK